MAVRRKLKKTDIFAENKSITIAAILYIMPWEIPASGVPSSKRAAVSRTASEFGRPAVNAASVAADPEGICRLKNVVETE